MPNGQFKQSSLLPLYTFSSSPRRTVREHDEDRKLIIFRDKAMPMGGELSVHSDFRSDFSKRVFRSATRSDAFEYSHHVLHFTSPPFLNVAAVFVVTDNDEQLVIVEHNILQPCLHSQVRYSLDFCYFALNKPRFSKGD